MVFHGPGSVDGQGSVDACRTDLFSSEVWYLPRGVNTLHMSPARRPPWRKKNAFQPLCFVGETMLVLGPVLLFKCRWLSPINMRYTSERRAQPKTFEDIWRFSLLLQLQSSTIRYCNLFMLNSFVAIWPFGGLSSFDLPSRTFWDPITYTPFQLKLEAETLGGGYFLEMIMEAMLDFPGHTGIPHGMTCLFFGGKLSTKESPYPPFRYFFWKTWCPCPPDLSTGCRSECQQRSTAKVKVDEGNGRKKAAKTGCSRWMTILLDGQFGTPKSITCSYFFYIIYYYLTFRNHRKLMNFGHRLETQLIIYWLLKCRAPFCH